MNKPRYQKQCNPNKNSKYFMKEFGEWLCTQVAVESVVGKKFKSFGKRHYYYIFERLTSDHKAFKMIRLSAKQAAKVWKGERTVESFLEYKEKTENTQFKNYISYNFVEEK